MGDPVVEKLKEDKAKIKATQRKRVRGVLIIVDALLLSYFSFLAVSSIVDYVKTNLKTGDDSIITLLNKSEITSKNIYNKYLVENAVEVNDFALYSHYLYTSKTRVTPSDIKVQDQATLFSVTKAVEKNLVDYLPGVVTIEEKLDQGINLFSTSFENGDYLLVDNSTYQTEEKFSPYHYNGKELLEETIYSFPNEKGVRRQVVVKAKASSPCIVVSISDTTYIPNDYYDLVVVGAENVIPELKEYKDLKIKYCTGDEALLDAYLANSCYAIYVSDIEQTKPLVSSYVKSNSSTNASTQISGGAYDKLDTDNAIRELGGYVFNAGYGAKYDDESITKASSLIMNGKKESHTGKYTVTISQTTPFDSYKELLGL